MRLIDCLASVENGRWIRGQGIFFWNLLQSKKWTGPETKKNINQSIVSTQSSLSIVISRWLTCMFDLLWSSKRRERSLVDWFWWSTWSKKSIEKLFNENVIYCLTYTHRHPSVCPRQRKQSNHSPCWNELTTELTMFVCIQAICLLPHKKSPSQVHWPMPGKFLLCRSCAINSPVDT